MRITAKTTINQMLGWLEANATKTEVVTTCLLVNRRSDDEIPEYGSKRQLIRGLECVDRDVLADVVEELFPTDDDDDDDEEEGDEDEDDDSDDEEEDAEDEEE